MSAERPLHPWSWLSDFALYVEGYACRGPHEKCPPGYACHSMRAEVERRGIDAAAMEKKIATAMVRLRELSDEELGFMHVLGEDGGLAILADRVRRSREDEGS